MYCSVVHIITVGTIATLMKSGEMYIETGLQSAKIQMDQRENILAVLAKWGSGKEM